jgi:hypothetical protein
MSAMPDDDTSDASTAVVRGRRRQARAERAQSRMTVLLDRSDD